MFGQDGGCAGEEGRRVALHRALDVVLDARRSDSGVALGEAIRAASLVSNALDGSLVGEVLEAFEASGQWAIDGCASPTAWLVGETGRARAAALSLRGVARDVATLPHVLAAARAGALPLSHLRSLAKARTPEVAEVFDRDEADLVAEAATLGADALQVRLKRWRFEALEELARNEPDGEPPVPPEEADRLRLTKTFGGRGVLDGELGPESHGVMRGAIDAEIDRWFRSGALAEDTRSRAELEADALMAIIRRGAAAGTAHGGARPLVIGVGDLDTLFDRADVAPEDRFAYRSDILGGGPVAGRTVRRLLCDAHFSLVITDSDGEPLWTGRGKRLASYAQIRAMIARSGGVCEACNCGTPWYRCHAHHLHYWRNKGPTDIDNLALTCTVAHTNIHERGFTLTRGPDGLEYRNPHGQMVSHPYRNVA